MHFDAPSANKPNVAGEKEGCTGLIYRYTITTTSERPCLRTGPLQM